MSSRSPSALRRGAPAARRDPDQTDPAAHLLEGPDEDTGEETLAVGPNDATQVYDANQLAAATGPKFKLVVLAGPKAGAEFTLGTEEVVIGRSAENAISIPDVSVSRRHASLVVKADGTFTVKDLGSGNGTRLNEEKITTAAARHGDQIAMGDTVLQLVQEGVPLEKKARKPEAPKGQTGDAAAPTRAQPKITPAPAKKPQVVATPAGAIPSGRKRLYKVAGAVVVLLFGLGLVSVYKRNQRVEQKVAAANAELGDAQSVFKDARRLAFEHKWDEAVTKAEEALGILGEDAAVQGFLDQAKVEAGNQKKVSDARARMEKQDFAGARALLDGVPREADVFPQARELRAEIVTALETTLGEARALADSDKEKAKELVARVLEAEPDNGAALDLKAQLEKEARPARSTSRTVVVRREENPEPPKDTGMSGPAVQAYLAGDLQRALRLAEDDGDDGLLKLLRAFDANYRQGIQLAQQQRAPEAVKVLGEAVKIDRKIANGRSSKPGKEAGHQLANMEYLLGIDCRGDDGLPCRTRHFRAALKAEPGHPLAKKQLEVAEGRAREIYTEAYMLKSPDPDRAIKLFKTVRDALPPSDETHTKAARWYENLGGK